VRPRASALVDRFARSPATWTMRHGRTFGTCKSTATLNKKLSSANFLDGRTSNGSQKNPRSIGKDHFQDFLYCLRAAAKHGGQAFHGNFSDSLHQRYATIKVALLQKGTDFCTDNDEVSRFKFTILWLIQKICRRSFK
jgi:hypothetical protein